jgi:hypothetical protein
MHFILDCQELTLAEEFMNHKKIIELLQMTNNLLKNSFLTARAVNVFYFNQIDLSSNTL